MTEEEKQAIDILMNEIADIVVGEYCTHCKICENDNTECYYIKAIDNVYNLIEQQQKEIEMLKKQQQDVKNRIEYYLVGNVSLDNFEIRNKELRKIEKMLEE